MAKPTTDKAKVKLKKNTPKGKANGIYAEKIKDPKNPDKFLVLMDGLTPDPVWVTEDEVQ